VTINSRAKGIRFELKLVKLFRAVMPGVEINRGLQSRGGGGEIPDVDMPVFHVEAKSGKRPNIRAAMRQAREQAKSGMIPIAVVKDDRQPAMVTIGLSDFLRFVEQWWPTQRAVVPNWLAGGGPDEAQWGESEGV
jgi:hypothetical protein